MSRWWNKRTQPEPPLLGPRTLYTSRTGQPTGLHHHADTPPPVDPGPEITDEQDYSKACGEGIDGY